jgi:exportin-2 (importin alpha re-exporter)
MIHSDRGLIAILKEIIVNICKEGDGYVNAWPQLMKLFASILTTKNYILSYDIYDIIKKITKRYRVEQLTQQLVKEIKDAIANIAPLMTDDCITLINYFYSKDNINPEQLCLYLQITTCIMHIFLSFNSPDFPEYFEDNLPSWMNILKGILDIDLNLDGEIFNHFLKMKTIGMRCLNQYCLNYYEDMLDYHNSFIPVIWNLLKYARTDISYAKLVKQLLDYYKTLFQYSRTAGMFNQEAAQLLIDNLVIPNLQLTSKDLDDFEDNPINFTRIELEEVDMDSSNKY